jgi:hypothetical protein
MGATLTTADKILKYVYNQRALQNAVYKKNPAFAMIKKETGFNGRSHIHAITYGNSNARNAQFAVAQSLAGINGAVNNGVVAATAATDSGFNQDANFTVTRQKNFAAYTLEQELLLAAKGDNGSFVKAVTQLVDGTLQTLNNDFGKEIYGDATGAIGLGTVTVAALVFTVGESIVFIEKGMALVCSATRTGAIRGAGAAVPMIVTSVNRSAGSFTVDANTDACATGDTLFIAGDRITGAIATFSTRLKIAGFEAWNPVTAPTAGDNFYGTDRSVDVTRLSGHRLDVSGLMPEEGYITGLSALGREESDVDKIFTSYTDDKNIKLALGSRAIVEYSTVGDIGFESIKIRGPNGPVSVFPDRNAPVGYARLLTMSSWEYKHLGEFVNKGDAAGDGGMAREYRADRYYGQFSCYGNLFCYAPSQNMVLTLPT